MSQQDPDESTVDDAVAAIRDGKLVVYPTETVYGLGGDALDAGAVDRVFEAKGRDRDEPLSLGLESVEALSAFATLTDRERAFADRFLPGPVTLVVARPESVPENLTAGGARVGIRVPAHSLARELLAATGPLTATSANVSGGESARRLETVDPAIREEAAVLLDGGESAGGGSTVVDVEAERIHRRGALANQVETWLADN